MESSAPAVRPEAAAGPRSEASIASVGAGRAMFSAFSLCAPSSAAWTRPSKLSFASVSAFVASSRALRSSASVRLDSSFTSLRWSLRAVITPSSSVIFSARASACFLCSSPSRRAVASSLSKCASSLADASRSPRVSSCAFRAAACDAARRSEADASSRFALAASRLASSSASAAWRTSADAALRAARRSSDFFATSARSQSLCSCMRRASCSMRAFADSNAALELVASRSLDSALLRSSLAATTLARWDSSVAFLSAISAFFCSTRSTRSRRDAFASESSAWETRVRGGREGEGRGGEGRGERASARASREGMNASDPTPIRARRPRSRAPRGRENPPLA